MSLIDPKWLGRCFDECAAELVLYARQWLDSATAEDIVQDAFIKLIHQRKPPRNVRAWLFRVVRHRAIDHLRKQGRRRDCLTQLPGRQAPWFDGAADGSLDAKMAQQALASLKPEQREIVVLRIWGQMSLKQIGQVVDKPLSTVHSRYQAALAVLKEKMETSCKQNTT